MIRSTLQTRLARGEIDICALLVNQQRRTRSDEDFVFFNQDRSRCGSTRRLSDVEIEVDLRNVPAAVDAIVIAVSLDNAIPGSVASHGGGRILVTDAASAITHTLAGLTSERCVIVAELYRRAAGWKLRAISQGFPDLAGLIAVYAWVPQFVGRRRPRIQGLTWENGLGATMWVCVHARPEAG